MTEVRITPEPSDSELAGVLLDRYYDELAARFPGGPDAFDLARIAARAEEFSPPLGVFLVARRAGDAVGCGAVRTLDAGRGEIKRMWVDPAVRGLGIGRGLLIALERAAGRTRCSHGAP